MVTEQSNPLSKFFRQPAIYVKLPSKGRWWANDALDLPVLGEVPVYPMTTRDEITLRTPDALLNGQGVVDVIQSCCPSIKNAWLMPSVDVDAVLIAIRIATYGNSMDFNSVCPHCRNDNVHGVDLGPLLDSINCPDYQKPVQYQTLKIKLHPQKYFTVNQSNRIQFEEEKISQTLNMGQDVDPMIKATELSKSMTRLVELGIDSIVDSVEYIELDTAERIAKQEHIKEFFQNAESSVMRSIQDELRNIAEQAKIKPLSLQCLECEKPYNLELTFDYANFFSKGF
jgi:hypothetical protein